MIAIRLQLVLSAFVLMAGTVLLWRRRDNIVGYLAGGLYLVTYFLPVMATDILEDWPRDTVELYLRIMTLGSGCYLLGLFLGAPFGRRRGLVWQTTFDKALDGGWLTDSVMRRIRLLGMGAAASLVVGYAALGYMPILATHKVLAKYGVGPYRAGFLAGGKYYLFALAVASTAVPAVLAAFYRRRRLLDLVLAGVLVVGLLASLSRSLAFGGVLMFVVAVVIHRGWKPVLILALVVGAYVAGELSNLVLLSGGPDSDESLLVRVIEGPPDLRENLAFMDRYELYGEQTQGRTLLAGLLPTSSYWEPSTFTLRTISGTRRVEHYASGGLRLPAPVWGYVSFGFTGVVIWTLFAGFFAGWGTVRLKSMLAGVQGDRHSYLNLVLAAVFYAGTFGVLATFYLTNSAMLVSLALALYLGLYFRPAARSATRVRRVPPTDERQRISGGRGPV